MSMTSVASRTSASKLSTSTIQVILSGRCAALSVGAEFSENPIGVASPWWVSWVPSQPSATAQTAPGPRGRAAAAAPRPGHPAPARPATGRRDVGPP
jgi:hypothetical protein